MGRSEDVALSVSDPVPLVVDMDGTLLRTDTLHESVIGALVASPATLLLMPGWLREGRHGFKARIAQRFLPDAALLPVEPKVVELIENARTEGRPVALISGADQRIVGAVAQRLGLFDLAVGSNGPQTDGVNLSGPGKAAWLTDRFGKGGFDYAGDSRADLPVWQAARRGFAVGGARRVAGHARRAGVALQPVPTTGRGWQALLRAMRPHQWAKNVLVLVPALAAHEVTALGPALIAAIAFCAAASSVYLVNDMLDLEADRAHPRKRLRPMASGTLPLARGAAAAAALMLAALALALALPPAFRSVLAAYLVATFAYSLWLKRKLLVDVIALAMLYTLRILGGAAATGIALSPWLLGFSMFVFFSLATIKRQAELVDVAASGRSVVRGRGYFSEDLPVLRSMAVTSGQAAVLVFALYVNSPGTSRLYHEPALLWLICPVLFFWISRMAVMTHRGHMHDDPVVFALRDRVSQMSIFVMIAIAVIAAVGWR